MARKGIYVPSVSVDASVDLDEFNTEEIISYLGQLYATHSLDERDMEDLRELADKVLNSGLKNNLAHTLKMEIVEENIDRFTISELQERLK